MGNVLQRNIVATVVDCRLYLIWPVRKSSTGRLRFISMQSLVACAIENRDCRSGKQVFRLLSLDKINIVNKTVHQLFLSNGL